MSIITVVLALGHPNKRITPQLTMLYLVRTERTKSEKERRPGGCPTRLARRSSPDAPPSTPRPLVPHRAPSLTAPLSREHENAFKCNITNYVNYIVQHRNIKTATTQNYVVQHQRLCTATSIKMNCNIEEYALQHIQQ